MNRILFVSHTGIVGGAERSLLGLIEDLDRERFEPLLCAPAEGSLLERAAALAVPVEEIPPVSAAYRKGFAQSATSLWAGALAMRSRIARLRPRLVHANSLRSGLLASALTRRIPTVWHVRDLLPDHPANRVIQALSQAGSVHWVANSLAVAASLRTMTRKPVRVVYNGIKVERFERPGEDAWPRIPTDAYPLIGIIGQIIPWKGQLELIDAFAELLNHAPKAQLWIIGAPLFREESLRYEAAIKERIRRPDVAGKVSMFGAREDIPGALASLDILAVNSAAEPFGRVILEAQAAGVPVVATQAGGAVELIRDGETGLLVAPGDITAMARALVTLASGLTDRQRIISAARRQVLTHFTQERMADRMEAIYEELLAC